MNFFIFRQVIRLLLVLSLGLGVWVNAFSQTCSIPGQSGANAALTAQPNTFFAGSLSPGAGAAFISVGAGAGFSSPINAGDLLLIIQMQGADINTSNTNAYGAGVSAAGVTNTVAFGSSGYAGGITGTNFVAGTYEWAVATGGGATFAAGGTINLSKGLTNSYFTRASTAAVTVQTWQVVRVPQYSNLTLTGAITLQPWNGLTGGLLVLDAAGDINLNAQTINGNGSGFRAAGAVNVNANGTCTAAATTTGCQTYTSVISASYGGSKGEGLVGTPARIYNGDLTGAGTGAVTAGTVDGYPTGEASRGAPGNAGGGGNQHNAGGGGGANGGAGGKGGNTWNSSTNGFAGLLLGGFGGSPPAVSATRWILAGGGGAGDIGGNTSNTPQGSGGAGGGMVILRASRLLGGGATINLNGATGVSTTTTDASGGGGAGGTLIAALGGGGVSGAVTVNANGGNGGSYGVSGLEQDGPGGGGGGGILIHNIATGTITFNAGGGLGGGSVTTSGCQAASNACGSAAGNATAGAAGYAITSPGLQVGYECLPNLTVIKSTTTPTVSTATGGTAGYIITVSNSGGGARFVNVLDLTLPPGWTLNSAPTYAYSPAQPLAAGRLSSGAETAAITTSRTWVVGATPLTVPANGSNTLTWSAFAIAPVTSGVASVVTITFVATIPDTATVGTYHNGAGITFLDPTRTSASTRTVSPLTSVSANRSGTAYSANTAYNTYAGFVNTTNVSGSNYSGLVAGPTTEDVTLLPDFSITKTAPAAATPGTTFTYTITPRNNGRAVASQTFLLTQATDVSTANVPSVLGSSPLTVTDTLPSGVTVSTAFNGTGWSCSPTTPVVCTLANAAAYPISAATNFPSITATVTVTAICSGGSALTNTATISLGANEPSSVTANNTATAPTALSCVSANITVTKTNGTTTVTAGSVTAYTVTVVNLGPGAASGVILTDPATPGLSCTSVTCTSAGGASCPISPSIAALQGAGLTISPSFPANSTASFVVSCGVTATGQ
jgi:uncharacterized repeat protein (TIGR01451 family)